MSNIYLFGPMAGIPKNNAPAFKEAREKLRAMGHDVFCPVEFSENTGIVDIRQAMSYDLAYIIKEAQLLVGLEGWRASGGSLVEVHLAWRLKIPVYEYELFSRRVLREVKNAFVWNYGEAIGPVGR